MQRLAMLVLLLVSAAPATAFGFCGFYVAGGDAKLFNDATQVVLMRDKRTTVLSMQNNYEGPTEDFAMIVPVPEVLRKERVKTLDKETFDRVDQLSAPRLVEYWERDPCATNLPGFATGGAIGFGGLGLMGSGRGGGGSGYVKIEAEFKVGEYDIVILSTDDATALDGWLKSNKYNIPAGAEPYFRPYVEKGSYFFVAKVAADRVKMVDGKAVLSPLRFHYESDEFSLPIRLGMINSKGKQDLLVYILGYDQRYEVANYPNVTIPTNIEVGPAVRDGFGEFYEALFSRTTEENPKAIVTEYSWAAAKCDPCPGGLLGGTGLQPQVLATLGNDILNLEQGWNQAGWTLTRLHARYGPDDIGEDLVFEKADAISGGREVFGEGRALEKGAQKSANGNNFQGRYIMRHEWEGTVECDKPDHGNWGAPPDAHGMTLVADTVVAELRRQAAAAAGREPTPEELAAPHSAAERKAVGFHLRKRFGTSVAPASAATSGPATAPSANTRGGALGGAPADLATLVREAVPELKIEPKEAPAAVDIPPLPPAASETTPEATPAATPAAKCSVASVPGALGSGGWWAVFGLFVWNRRRRRATVELN